MMLIILTGVSTTLGEGLGRVIDLPTEWLHGYISGDRCHEIGSKSGPPETAVHVWTSGRTHVGAIELRGRRRRTSSHVAHGPRQNHRRDYDYYSSIAIIAIINCRCRDQTTVASIKRWRRADESSSYRRDPEERWRWRSGLCAAVRWNDARENPWKNAWVTGGKEREKEPHKETGRDAK